MLIEYIVKLLLLTFIKNVNWLSATTVYMKTDHLQYIFKLNLMIIIFSAVYVQTVIEMHRLFSITFININLY